MTSLEVFGVSHADVLRVLAETCRQDEAPASAAACLAGAAALDGAAELKKERDEARAENQRLRAGIHAVEYLISQSAGVAGLHVNGDLASWESLRSGGFFESWLRDFDAAAAGDRCPQACPHGDRCRLEAGHQGGCNHGGCECNEPNDATGRK